MRERQRTIYVIVGTNYASTMHVEKIIAGIKDGADRNHVSVKFVASPEQMGQQPRARAAVVIGVKKEWVYGVIQKLRLIDVKPVLAGAERSDFGEDVSVAGLARQMLVEDMVKYFYYAGRRRLASVGNESFDVNDIKRIRTFTNAAENLGLAVSEHDIYTLDGGAQSCIDRFLDNTDRYDGAICVNDYVAVRLLVSARERGISIPGRLYVAGAGDIMLGRCTQPSLTTTTLDYYNIGMQCIKICRMLDQDLSVDTVSIMVPSKLIYRESTAYASPPPQAKTVMRAPPAPIAEPEQTGGLIGGLVTLENCLRSCDELDYRILDGILCEKSIDEIADDVFVSSGTVQYRLKKIYKAVGVSSKTELVNYSRPYLHSVRKNLAQVKGTPLSETK